MIGEALELFRDAAGRLPGGWIGYQVAAAGVAAAWLLARARRDRARLDRALLAFVAGLAGAALGAAALPVLLRVPAWIRSGLDAAVLLRGDWMAYGALLGLAAAYATAASRLGRAPRAALDALAAPMGALLFITKIGCFTAGCDFGAVTSAPWAVRYPEGSHAFARHLADGLLAPGDAASLPVHPTQLYEALGGAAMAAAALGVERARSAGRLRLPSGAAFAAAAATYAAARMVAELFRGDPRGALGPLSAPQWLSLAVLVYSTLWLAGGREPRDAAPASLPADPDLPGARQP